MAEYGLLSEVVAEPRGSFLAAAASVSDAELTVEYAGDFDPEGGILDLNGTRIDYTEIVDGINPDDPDTLTLAAPLTVSGDESDIVQVVIGGQLAVDYVAHVATDDGDQVSIPIRYDQINGWPVGQYDPAVPVTFSEDHEHLEDAPGRTPLGRISAWNLDEAMALTDDDAVAIILSYAAALRSIQVKQNGLDLAPDEWTYDAETQTITIEPSDEVIIRAGQRFTSYYDRDEAAGDISPILEPIEWGSYGPNLIVAEGDTTNYSSPSFDDSGWTAGPAPLGYPVAPPDPFWDIPPATSVGGTNLGFWIRREFTLQQAASVDAWGRTDGQHWLYLDGVLIHSYTGPLSGVDSEFTVTNQALSAGTHLVALHINDDVPEGPPDAIYGDVQVVLS